MQNNDIQTEFDKLKIKEETKTKQYQDELDTITVYQNVKRGVKHVILIN